MPSAAPASSTCRAGAVPAAVAPLLGDFAEYLRRRFGKRLREVTLFGSWAKGTPHEESDLDVLVVVDALTTSERREIWNAAFDLDEGLGGDPRHLSPLCYPTAQANELRTRERQLLREIDTYGVSV